MEPRNGEARDFRFLFSPIKVGDREVKNRIVSTAHATGFDQGGVLSERHLRYHERKAAGGAGLIMTFGSASDPGAVVLATGSSPAIPPEADGVEVPCATDVDLLDGRVWSRVSGFWSTTGRVRSGAAA